MFMTDSSDSSVYYVVSDLHIGGDEQLEQVDFLDEFLAFLDDLADRDESIELIINGDAFGLWEFTTIEGVEKFDALLERYPELFEQFAATGESIDITILPGNHDHDLAAYEAYVDRFAEYNVDLVREESITRPIGDRRIHFEHGHQRDPNNRFEDFGNPFERPLGYYYNTHVVSRAGHLSPRGRFNWLKDVQAVTPTERMPSWLLSKYFYREMNPVLRYALIPFLLLFNISVLLAFIAGLDLVGVWSMPVERTAAFLRQFGLAGTAVYVVLAANVAIGGILILVGVPLYLILRDVRQTIERFGVLEEALTVDPEAPYVEAAREVFEDDSSTSIFCVGHTHRPTLRPVDDGLLVNSGTWLKRLHRREVVTGVLPPVYYSSYQMGAVRIAPEEQSISISFEWIDKPSPNGEDLTLTERLLTLGREPSMELPNQHTIELTSDY